MGKSVGNAIFLKDLFERYPPLVIRFFILSSHYRSPTDFSNDALDAAQKGLERLHATVGAVRERLEKAPSGPLDESWLARLAERKAAVLAFLDDDFNTAGAIGELFDVAKDVNTLLNSGEAVSQETLQAIDDFYREMGGQILGVIPDELTDRDSAGLDDALMEVLLEVRAQLRQAKQWELADRVRDRLAEIGVTVEDRPEGPTWRIAR